MRKSTPREKRKGRPRRDGVLTLLTVLGLALVIVLLRSPASLPVPQLTLTGTPISRPIILPSTALIPTMIANKQWTAQYQDFGGVTMALVPPGCFMMGLTDTEIATLNKETASDWSDAGTQFRMCIDKPFWIDKYLVTNAQFAQFNGKAERQSNWTGRQRPRETITWFEARDFCTVRGARLPTEAEWEYAARGPDDLIYPWGNTFSEDKAAYADHSNYQTADVGSKADAMSWVGSMDMEGNVYEWTSSIYEDYPYKADVMHENNTDTHSKRVLRAGSWVMTAVFLQSAERFDSYPSTADFDVGFRCARPFDTAISVATPVSTQQTAPPTMPSNVRQIRPILFQ